MREQWNQKKLVRVLCLLAADVILINLAAFFALYLRFEFSLYALRATGYLSKLLHYALINTVVTVVIFFALKLYNSLWEFASTVELMRIAVASGLSAIAFHVGTRLMHYNLPRSFPLIYFLLLAAGCALIRWGYRAIRLGRRGHDGIQRRRTMIIGGGAAGAMVIREFLYSVHSENKVVCILDDDPAKVGTYLRGVRVVGTTAQLKEMVQKYRVEEIVLAIPSAARQQRARIVDLCQETPCRLRTLPGLYQIANGEVSIQSLREVDIEDLLGRDTVCVNMHEVACYITGKTVLVTGGGGSIGSELCRQAAEQQPKKLIIFDIYENNAYDLELELRRKHPNLDLLVLIGSVRDAARVNRVFETYRPDVVCHAAAHKHVPLMEVSPFEAIKNNVFGTRNVARAAGEYGTHRFILISTDKAVNPTNVMGASKRICEMIVQTMNDRYAGTDFVAVRFGNVLGSAGSVIPLFRRQIKEGGPVTVTDKNVVRYFMTIPEAVQLIFQAGAYARGGEIFVLDMGDPVRIDDLARNMIRLSGLEPDVDIEIRYTGLRPGEKLYEELLLSEEGMQKTRNDLIYIGHELAFDKQAFADQLKTLESWSEPDDAELRAMIAQIVPTYHEPAQNHTRGAKGEHHAASGV